MAYGGPLPSPRMSHLSAFNSNASVGTLTLNTGAIIELAFR
jgi:hypothetical protein